MDKSIIIIFIIGFALIAEVLTWTNNNSAKNIRIYVSGIRFLVFALAIAFMNYVENFYQDEHDFLLGANKYKHEILYHYDTLRTLQDKAIESITRDCENGAIDVPTYDGYLMDSIVEQEHIIDSLYNNEL